MTALLGYHTCCYSTKEDTKHAVIALKEDTTHAVIALKDDTLHGGTALKEDFIVAENLRFRYSLT